MDPRDPRARRIAAAARSPFPALRAYAAQALAEPEERGYFTDPEEPGGWRPEAVGKSAEPEVESLEHLAEQRWVPEPEPPAPPIPAPHYDPVVPATPPPSRPPVIEAISGPQASPEPTARPLYHDILLAGAVSCLAFFAVRPLVPAPKAAAPVVPLHLTDRSGGAIEATLGAPITALPPNAGDLAVEIPLPDFPAPSASPGAERDPAAPSKRVGVWLTVQSPAELAQIYTALSRHHLERENWDQARYYADKVLGTWPDNADARRLRDAARKGLGVGP